MKFLAFLLFALTATTTVFAGSLGAPKKPVPSPNQDGVAASQTWDHCSYKKDLVEVYIPHWPGSRKQHEFYCNEGHTHVAATHLETYCDWDDRSRVECHRGANFTNMIHCESYIWTGCAIVHMLCCTRHGADPRHVADPEAAMWGNGEIPGVQNVHDVKY